MTAVLSLILYYFYLLHREKIPNHRPVLIIHLSCIWTISVLTICVFIKLKEEKHLSLSVTVYEKDVLHFRNILNCIIETFFPPIISDLAYKMLFIVVGRKVRLTRVFLVEKIFFWSFLKKSVDFSTKLRLKQS